MFAKNIFFIKLIFIFLFSLPLLANKASSLAEFEPLSVFENILDPFTSDGCSLLRDGTRGKNKRLWRSCCVDHDLAYWKGGTDEDRDIADSKLCDCVDEKTNTPGFGRLIYEGVRLGGSAHLPFSFRWGYGWRINQGYDVLSASRLHQVENMVKEIEYPIAVKRNKIFHKKITVTGDYCVDSALASVMKKTKSDKINYKILKDKSYSVNNGYKRELIIWTDTCSKSLSFEFNLSDQQSCKPNSSELSFRAQVKLDASDIEKYCN